MQFNILISSTWSASVGNPEEFVVAARVVEERRVHCQVAASLSCTSTVQGEVDVNVAVALKWNLTFGRYRRVVTAVASGFEHDLLPGSTGHLEDGIEAGVLLNDTRRDSVCKRRENEEADEPRFKKTSSVIKNIRVQRTICIFIKRFNFRSGIRVGRN
jgi:hypothetical protein